MPMLGTVPAIRERDQNNDTLAPECRKKCPGTGHHQSFHHGREAWLTRLCLALTISSWAMGVWVFAEILPENLRGPSPILDTAGTLLVLLIFSGLVYGSAAYIVARLGCIQRRKRHVPAERETLERYFDDEHAPTLAILIPSYKEEPDAVRHTLLSAALQDYPRRHVVLLVDDPPAPANAEEAAQLKRMRALPQEIAALLRPQAARFAAEYQAFLRRRKAPRLDWRRETLALARLCHEAAAWFEAQACAHRAGDHSAVLLARLLFEAVRDDHRRRAEELEYLAEKDGAEEARLLHEYRRLNSLLRVELSCFERKRYVNLPHAGNKAMNLNSYIAIMGRSFREVARADGLHLQRCLPAKAEITVPDTKYLVTLDADSLIAPDYALRLIHLMEQPGNERLAVAQTPYSAVPGAPGVLERVAGATTDIQRLVHQGFTAYRATYWVGANALLRVAALRDIATDAEERGLPIKRFIHDRTVIEDTESSVDLIARGWRLHNYHEVLAYSATPPDFGALVIQRRRWANGGLIILPKLLRYLAMRPHKSIGDDSRDEGGRATPGAVAGTTAEGFLRVYYLASPAVANIGLLLLLALPFGEDSLIVWVPLAAAPYFFLYTRDLIQTGYHASDALRVYALNLLLLPVNVGGVLRSLQQAITGRKSPFGRTPKVAQRTAVPMTYALAGPLLLGLWSVGAGVNVWHGHWLLAGCGLVNAAFLGYAVHTFVGWKQCREDVRLG